MQKVILNQLLTVKYSSINNFYSPTAKLTEGALQQAMRDFKASEEQGLIKKIPLDRKTRQKRQKQFYQVTKKGANTRAIQS